MRPSSTVRPSSLRAGFICRSCLSRRQLSTSTSTSHPSPPPAPLPSGVAALGSRRLISVSGPDAPKYLQGVITANINGNGGQPRDSGFYTAFLGAQGRILHDVFIYPNTTSTMTAGAGGSNKQPPVPGTSFLIEVDAGQAETLQRHIKRYKLRAKFDLRLLDVGEATVWHAWDDASGRAGLSAADNGGLQDGGLKVHDTRVPGFGYRFITAGEKPPSVELDRTGEDAYRIRRYLNGIPEGQDELERERALPQESNMDFMGAIDWHKGCYVGQELTIRTKHRGVVRKRVLPCVLYDPAKPMPDELVYRPGVGGDDSVGGLDAATIPSDVSIGRFGKKGRSAGKWLNGIGNIGLALCRLEIMTGVALPGEAAAAAYNPADEFIMEKELDEDQGGLSVKVKAFVPDWLRQGLEGAQ